MISRVTSYRPDHRLLRGCVAQPQDPAEWPLPPRPPDPGGAERGTGPQTGERCAILENKLMKRTVHLTAWLAPYPILRGAKHPAQIWSKDSTWEICEYLPISVPPYLLEFVN